MASGFFTMAKEKSMGLVSTIQEHISSVTDTTGTLAKQKILQKAIASGVVKSEDIRQALKMGICHFLDNQSNNMMKTSEYIQREKFPAAGSTKTPPHSLPDFDIEAYGLQTFDSLMNMYGINREILRAHISDGELKEIANPASSGSLLYLTSDSSFLIKTVRDYDAKFIQQKFLNEYHDYINKHTATFIAKLFGCYGYVRYLSESIDLTVDAFTLRFGVFSNFIPTNLEIHEKYDLKGSSYKRDAHMSEKLKSSATFKDNDFREIHPQGLMLSKSVYDYLKEVITRDVNFLESLNIMDYSLLLTVHNMDNQVKPMHVSALESLLGNTRDTFLVAMGENVNEKKQESQRKTVLKFDKPIQTSALGYKEVSIFDTINTKEFGGIPAINEKGEHVLLFCGIIDILQTFDICKVMQRQYQTVENRDVVNERSIVEADFYAKRFKEFVFEHVFRPAQDELPTHPVSMNVFSMKSSYQ